MSQVLLNVLISLSLSTDASNGHWTPAWKWCRLCEVDYNFIIKLEEEPLELWYLVEQLGLWRDREQFLRRTNNSENPGHLSDQEIFQNSVERLSNVQRAWVNMYFQMDFKLFGYEKLKLIHWSLFLKVCLVRIAYVCFSLSPETGSLRI